MGKSDYKKVHSGSEWGVKFDLGVSHWLRPCSEKKKWMKKILTRGERRRGKRAEMNLDGW